MTRIVSSTASRTRAPEIGTFSANSSVIIHRVSISLSLSPSFHRQVTKTNDPFDSPKHTRKNIRAILRHARHPAPRFYARFPLFCAWPLLPRKKKKREKERKEKVKRRETMNKVRQGDRGEGTRIEFFARTSVVSARVETSSIIPTDTRLLFWILPRFSRRDECTCKCSSIYMSKGSFLLEILSDPKKVSKEKMEEGLEYSRD